MEIGTSIKENSKKNALYTSPDEDEDWVEQLYEDMELDDLMDELDFNVDVETDYGLNRNDEFIPEEVRPDESTTGEPDSETGLGENDTGDGQ